MGIGHHGDGDCKNSGKMQNAQEINDTVVKTKLRIKFENNKFYCKSTFVEKGQL